MAAEQMERSSGSRTRRRESLYLNAGIIRTQSCLARAAVGGIRRSRPPRRWSRAHREGSGRQMNDMTPRPSTNSSALASHTVSSRLPCTLMRMMEATPGTRKTARSPHQAIRTYRSRPIALVKGRDRERGRRGPRPALPSGRAGTTCAFEAASTLQTVKVGGSAAGIAATLLRGGKIPRAVVRLPWDAKVAGSAVFLDLDLAGAAAYRGPTTRPASFTKRCVQYRRRSSGSRRPARQALALRSYCCPARRLAGGVHRLWRLRAQVPVEGLASIRSLSAWAAGRQASRRVGRRYSV
jgi:hypothetical protein